eukprot:4071-Heterococcus_DN1.PRE.2
MVRALMGTVSRAFSRAFSSFMPICAAGVPVLSHLDLPALNVKAVHSCYSLVRQILLREAQYSKAPAAVAAQCTQCTGVAVAAV